MQKKKKRRVISQKIKTIEMPAKQSTRKTVVHNVFHIVLTVFLCLLIGVCAWYFWYSTIRYKNRIFPAVYIDNIAFGGKMPSEVKTYWLTKNMSFGNTVFEFTFEKQIATITGEMIDLGYDATLSATQAYLVGRSPHFFANINDRIFQKRIDLPAAFMWQEDVVRQTIASMSAIINIPSQEALFTFGNGKVNAFRPSINGREVDEKELLELFQASMPHVASGNLTTVSIPVPINPIYPKSTTENVNTFGIKELIGRGYSEFSGSIPGRIHNVLLAAGKLNGVLIKPGEMFSFNKTVGDISAATGYQSAYIIKEGRTVMGDGGGVCQVSTTLFRAALNAGLPITERHEHSYRVHYYEEGGFKPGIDATVYDPTDDLKIKNDTPGYILIQTKSNLSVPSLTFELYGTSDGRKAEILNHKVWGITPPPPDLYQDDPTLPKGTVKQVDFAAWGAKASFEYKVTKNGKTLINQTFNSNFRPWQAVYLRGTKE